MDKSHKRKQILVSFENQGDRKKRTVVKFIDLTRHKALQSIIGEIVKIRPLPTPTTKSGGGEDRPGMRLKKKNKKNGYKRKKILKIIKKNRNGK